LNVPYVDASRPRFADRSLRDYRRLDGYSTVIYQLSIYQL